MKPIYDIRQQIPQFSANFFPPYEYQPYPRMMVNKETGKPYLDASKNIVAVHSAEEEAAFWASLAPKTYVPVVEAPKAIDVLMAAKPVERHQFEAITPADAEKADKPAKRKYTRKLSA